MEDDQNKTPLQKLFDNQTEENWTRFAISHLGEKIERLEKRLEKADTEQNYKDVSFRHLARSMDKFKTKLDTFPDPLKNVNIGVQTDVAGLRLPIVRPGRMPKELVQKWMTHL